ncbi:hypothetical protein [Halomonas sp. SL1]|uniref:hypothetical protein n=1 Tax=Halomonas sp. SL1 TaxID=2137478 RepID=UPI000D178858|nr:hypothetical protein [Halomonas sp. SL1]RAH37439.1 hypothetical protein C9J49_011090 [Halomonas sp. SL1]
MSDQPTTDINALFDDLDAGIFRNKFAQALGEAAAGVIQTGKQGKVTITLDLKQIADSSQVDCSHKLSYTVPTAKGKKSEENTTKTPLYVGRGGKLTLFPENQGKFDFSQGQGQGSTQGA